MKCFYHNSVDAVAICKNCNRGVCAADALEAENGIACCEKCEIEVRAINEIIVRSKTSHVKVRSAYGRNAIIFALLGILFGGYGIFSLSRTPSFGWFSILAAAIFIVGSVLYYMLGQKYAALNDNSK